MLRQIKVADLCKELDEKDRLPDLRQTALS